MALQKHFHSVEVHKWRQILRASVELLDEVRDGHVGRWGLGSRWRPSGAFVSLLIKQERKPVLVWTS